VKCGWYSTTIAIINLISIINTVVFGFLHSWVAWSAHTGWASIRGQVSAVKPGATLPEVMLFPSSLQVMRHWGQNEWWEASSERCADWAGVHA